jgi:hypothetical protein
MADRFPELEMAFVEGSVQVIDADARGHIVDVVAGDAVFLEKRLHLLIELVLARRGLRLRGQKPSGSSGG